jgi:hypothetical protein
MAGMLNAVPNSPLRAREAGGATAAKLFADLTTPVDDTGGAPAQSGKFALTFA